MQPDGDRGQPPSPEWGRTVEAWTAFRHGEGATIQPRGVRMERVDGVEATVGRGIGSTSPGSRRGR